MILLDGPYISDFLLDTVAQRRFPVIATEYARRVGRDRSLSFIDESEAIRQLERNRQERLYTPSENSIGWISENLRRTGLPEKISRFKNKAKFRELVRPLYPAFRFRVFDFESLLNLSASELFLPCVIKPATGFFSLGVYPVSTESDFAKMRRNLQSDMERIQNLYPDEVLNTRTFIMEEFIAGEEYAIDAYYDAAGEPVILGIFKHLFSSDQDVSDRVYMTSSGIIRESVGPFEEFLRQIGNLAGVKNFPLHAEIRRQADGRLVPIEINPMRFGGWCTTPDLAHHAWGMNVYERYALDRKPDWPALIAGKEDSVYSLIVLDNSTGIPGADILSFNYDAVLEKFAQPLKLTKIDFQRYPLFGFLFVKTEKNNAIELERILHDDLKSYVQTA